MGRKSRNAMNQLLASKGLSVVGPNAIPPVGADGQGVLDAQGNIRQTVVPPPVISPTLLAAVTPPGPGLTPQPIPNPLSVGAAASPTYAAGVPPVVPTGNFYGAPSAAAPTGGMDGFANGLLAALALGGGGSDGSVGPPLPPVASAPDLSALERVEARFQSLDNTQRMVVVGLGAFAAIATLSALVYALTR